MSEGNIEMYHEYWENRNPALIEELIDDEVIFLFENHTYYSELLNSAIVKTLRDDMKMFKEIQKVLLEDNKPSIGDYLYIEEKYKMIVKISEDELQTLKEEGGGYHYASVTGSRSYSGSLDYPIAIPKEGLILRDEVFNGTCWTFSEQLAGARRGVQMDLQKKVWEF